MADNKALIERFYGAFANHDGDAMAACYSPDVRFSDPVFPDLRGREAGAMWRMLTSNPDSDLRVELHEHAADDATGTAHWIAYYTFPQTGRQVVNDIRATFRFADDRIVEHTDKFDFQRWARQALGPVALLLGWTGLIQKKVRGQARGRLDEFLAKEG